MNFGDMNYSDVTRRTEIKQLANNPRRSLLSSLLDSPLQPRAVLPHSDLHAVVLASRPLF
jgi:hypothetical protein